MELTADCQGWSSDQKTHFSAPSATAEGIEYYEDCKQDKAQMLYLATIHIDEGHYVILENA